jgi:pantoate--beta-alanine ligase
MQIIRTLGELRPALRRWREAGQTTALVPTMGALHDGHLSLIEAGWANADRVVATIFVNPLQFNDKKDLARYPRDEAADLAKLGAASCDGVWLPTVEELYPEGFSTTVSVKGVSDRWEGEHRPGHFDGVATVVAKLFIATMPDVALFGEKDWQQLAVIRRMAADLGLPIKIIGQPTVREKDGLAMSSRNALLKPDDRSRASAMFRLLEELALSIGSGAPVNSAIEQCGADLKQVGFDPIDYIAYVAGDSLEPLSEYRAGGRLIAAAFLSNVRLIDNVSVVSATV